MPADDGQTPAAVRGGWGLGIPKNLPAGGKDCAWHVLTYITSAGVRAVPGRCTLPDRPEPQLDRLDARARRALPYMPVAGRGRRERPDPRDRQHPGDLRDRRRGRSRVQPGAHRHAGRGDGLRRRRRTRRWRSSRRGGCADLASRPAQLEALPRRDLTRASRARRPSVTTGMETARAERAGRAASAPRAPRRPAARRAGGRLPGRLLALPAPLQPGHLVLRVGARSPAASTFIGLEQLPAPWSPTRCSGRRRSTRRSSIGVWASRSRCVLGTALALFFDLHLRGVVVRARRARPADAPDAGRRRADVAGPAQPRLGDRQLGARRARAARSRSGWAIRRSRCGRSSSSTRGSGRRSSWSSCSPGCRRCRGTSSRPPRWTAPAAGRRCATITLPLLAPAIVFAGDLPRHRRLPLVRPRLRPDLRRAGSLHDHAQLLRLRERLQLPRATGSRRPSPTSWSSSRSIGLTLLVRYARRPSRGRDVIAPAARARRSPTSCWSSSRSSASRRSSSSLILSTKTRIEHPRGPAEPRLRPRPVIVENYRTCSSTRLPRLHRSTRSSSPRPSVAVALVLGTPAAYAFSRLRFRGRDRWATTILSFRFMPPVAVAIPILLMMRSSTSTTPIRV